MGRSTRIPAFRPQKLCLARSMCGLAAPTAPGSGVLCGASALAFADAKAEAETRTRRIRKRPERPEMMKSGPESPARVKRDPTFLAVKQHKAFANFKI